MPARITILTHDIVNPGRETELTKTEAPAMPTLSTSTIWIYGSLGFPLALIGYPLGIWLPRAYATYIGIATESVGTIMIIASIFDAITDPVMGFASDRYRTRWGRRRMWVFIGAPFLLAALVYLLNPSVGNGVFYLGGWFVFLRIGSTMVGTPYGAWGAELSGEYHTRTRIVSVREVFVLLGLIGAALVPAIVEWMHGAETTAVHGVERLYVAGGDPVAAADGSGGDARARTAAERARRSRTLRCVVGPDVPEQAVPAADRDRVVHQRRRSVPQRAVAVLHAGLHRRAARRPAVSRLLRHGPDRDSVLELPRARVRQAPLAGRRGRVRQRREHRDLQSRTRPIDRVLRAVCIEGILLRSRSRICRAR